MSADFERGYRIGMIAAADVLHASVESLKSSNPDTHRAITAFAKAVEVGMKIAADKLLRGVQHSMIKTKDTRRFICIDTTRINIRQISSISVAYQADHYVLVVVMSGGEPQYEFVFKDRSYAMSVANALAPSFLKFSSDNVED